MFLSPSGHKRTGGENERAQDDLTYEQAVVRTRWRQVHMQSASSAPCATYTFPPPAHHRPLLRLPSHAHNRPMLSQSQSRRKPVCGQPYARIDPQLGQFVGAC